ncbi:hypothetical protein Ddye_030134 [Dipteronia dyeriana]|uniref:Mediator of RNA polymerase II transcription subunit n=1 Tax=Dipteronia dyeriana TaxID=168575 RepID=A0AAD9WM69_9ROSI|nr:hypothetical protein Ddye_030134 [Dipteronia dyeriana]
MSSSSISLTSSLHYSCGSLNERSKTNLNGRKRVSKAKVLATRDRDYPGRVVDENMIVLRKRIHEMKMVERNYEPPAEWMEWEKRYYTSYDSIICEVMGVLQSCLMNTRPSLALGMLALVLLSVPTSTAMFSFQILEITKGILAIL